MTSLPVARTALLPVPSAPVEAPVQAADTPPRPAPVLATSLTLLAVLLLAFAGYVLGLGAVFHARQQQLGYATLRADLANAVAPVGQTRDGALLPAGTPVALLEVPGTGIREVVREGTGSRVTASGPGHRRDTVLPGQAGTSVLFGRRAGFGGPFAAVPALRRGTVLRITTGQGRQEFEVVAVRRDGEPAAPLAPGRSRVTLVTADGPAFVPSGVVRVDADLRGPATPAPARALAAGALPPSEQALAGDRTGLVGLLLLAQALLLVACAAAWARARWGARQAWVVGVPALTLLGLAVAHQTSVLLPNLL